MAHPKHESVRQRYAYRCGYCGVSEVDAGGELTVDHYQPTSAEGDDSDDNLVYACIRCNLYKSDFFPSEANLMHGERLLHPLHDNVAAHIRTNAQSGLLEPVTETGRFHIELLQLNRPALILYRIREQQNALAAEIRQSLLKENEELRATISLLQRYISTLEERLSLRPDKEEE